MIGELALNNLIELSYLNNAISISQIEESGKALEQAETLADKFLLLKNDIGNELFEQLSYDDKVFMSETAGSIDFGHTIDLDQIAKEIKSYDDY
jgi:hypothetical protein